MEGINDCVDKLLTSKKSREKYTAAWLGVHWSGFGGGRFAGKSLPSDIKGNVLLVDVQSPAWSHALLMEKKQLIDEINKQINGIIIKDIKSTVRTLPPVLPPPPVSREDWPALTEQDARDIRAMLPAVADEGLREKLFNILSSLKRKQLYRQQKPHGIPPVQTERLRQDLCELFYHMPWLSYAQAREELAVTKAEYWEARQYCERRFLREALAGQASRADIMTYVMIKTGCGVWQLTDELISAVMSQAQSAP